MAKQSQSEIDQMIGRSRYSHRDLVRRDIFQVLQSSHCNLVLKLVGYYGDPREYLTLTGTVVCEYHGSRYNIPVEINLSSEHPYQCPSVYVRPTSNMFISPNNMNVKLDGTVTINYLRTWRHPNNDLYNLINAMSQLFSQSPPVYSGSNVNNQLSSSSTPYPINVSPIPMPVDRGSYSYGYPNQNEVQTPKDVYRESLQSAILEKVRNNLNEKRKIVKVEIDSLHKRKEDLTNGEKNLQLLIDNLQQQQIQAQNYITLLKTKINQNSQKSSSEKATSIQDDAIVISAPIYKQLFRSFTEEHAIQDLLFHLADGLRNKSIDLDVYLRHVRQLSRRQFILRATMIECRQIAKLTNK